VHYISYYSTVLCLQESTLSSQPWRFDPLSALIGAAVVALLVGLLYAFRARLRQAWEAVAVQLGKFMNYMRASADENYRRLVAAKARAFVVPAHAALLDAVFVEPRLLVPSRSSQSLSEAGHAAIGSRLMPLHRTLEGHSRLVIWGDSGMGKTATLGYLALVCATAFEQDERRRVDRGPMPESVWKRLPLYIMLSAMDWGEAVREEEAGAEEGAGGEAEAESAKPPRHAEPNDLTRAAVSAVEGGAGYTGALRQYLESGRAIVLVDGWDELTSHQRELAAAWLAELADALPGNIWLVAVGKRGYASLTEVGFVSLELAPWDTMQVEAFAKRWMEACAPEEKSSTLLSNLTAGLQQTMRLGASPLELTLRAFVYLADRQAPTGRAALFGRALDLLLEQQAHLEEEPWWLAACHAALGQVALDLQQGGRSVVGGEEIEAVIEAALPPHEERPVRAASRVFQALTGDRGLFRAVGSNRYTFVHPLWQAYLAARQLVAFEPNTLVEWLEDPQWSDVFRFYAELGDMRPLVEVWLRTPDDVFYTRLCTLGSWIGAAPEGAAWREGAMAILARVFLQPSTRAPTRWALAEALAATGVSGVAYFLKQALKRPEAETRSAAVLGLSRVARETDLPAFEEVLADEDVSVREAAVRALARLGTDAAKRRLAVVLLEGDDQLRPVAAAALARCGEEGVELLHELADSEDVMTRRAVVFGLAEIRARDTLQRMMREDKQWVVRTAATTADEELEAREKSPGAPSLPDIEQLPWLISWAATQGEGVGLGDAARRMLRRALAEGDAQVRMAAVQALIQVGRPDDVEVLWATLADSDPAIAGAALTALEQIGKRYDLRVGRK
jgi:HEAT repeat protein